MNGIYSFADRPASMYFGFFQSIFDAVDMTSSFWQPMMKSVGRSHLELASLAARQGQAVVRWQHNVAAQQNPMGVLEANAQLWQDMVAEYTSFAPRMVAAVAQASRALPAFEVVPLPERKQHDCIVIEDFVFEADTRLERRVA